MSEKAHSPNNEDSLDSLITRTLASDAEKTRARFATVPNARLTAKLALSTASRGLLGTLAAKFAIYGGATLIVGGALYFIPALGVKPQGPINTTTAQVKTTPAPSSNVSSITPAPTKLHPPKSSSQPTPQYSVAPIAHPPLQINEGDSSSIRHITNPKYQPPLK